jgi:S1-C subfamily serine protease
MNAGSKAIPILLYLVAPLAPLLAQSGSATLPLLTSTQIVQKASPAVVMVLTQASADSPAVSVSAGLVVSKDGDLLTAYHPLRNAYAVQVRFATGETYDRVKLLAFDERRDVAAIRISSSALSELPIAPSAEASPGEPVISFFHSPGMPWATSTGILSAYRLADDIPGAGSGFRVLQFTAPASPGVSGGILIDGQGRALGLITGKVEGGQALNFAVPVESVLGLVDNAPIKTFASGAQLLPMGATIAQSQSSPVGPVPVVQPPATPLATQSVPAVAPAATVEKQDLGTSRDRDYILRHFSTMYVDCKNATFLPASQLKAALARSKDFNAFHITFVDDPKVADTVLVVGYVFAWDYPFELKHPGSSLVLFAGKGYGPMSGQIGAISVANQFLKLAAPYRTPAAKP